ncbi:hypothetical protein Afil01_02070 [Actinorhabdospora filicis]|uniref:AIPR protein n=1 Tax=Actinorhabdospora filicis TaxID=1785913 RepID=A0A9W6SDT4_9ACTN|nr:AIPR family protein [Actinorhabdospora filicis]GLZ75400.1 hypothetical protein Afil01_02070 [Actinorhabdospora filicis]
MTAPDSKAFARKLWDVLGERRAAEPQLMDHDAFVQVVAEYLIEDGAIEELEPCYYRVTSGREHMEVAGYSISADCEQLELATVNLEYHGGTAQPSKGRRYLRRAARFLERCREGLHHDLEPASPAYDMAERIHSAWNGLQKARILLFTDGRQSLSAPEPVVIGGLTVVHEIWDITRLERLFTSGVRASDLDIDLSMQDPPVTCLAAPPSPDGYQCLLALIPGRLLAELYERHGLRLLQRNVRAFLQTRNKVNKRINETVRSRPGRFLAFNNGISVTTRHAELVQGEDGTQRIIRLSDLQIVNGGQTTASLHHAWRRDGADLTGILVPAKITVVDGDRLEELVPDISRYANSQNVIREADFEAGTGFHVQLEQLSRTIWAPAADGGEQQRWYYERVRGQFEVDVVREGTPARRRVFKNQNRRFGKTDAAKYDMAFLRRPHTVSLGAEKCFQAWTKSIVREFDGEPDATFFKDLVAKAILFTDVRKAIWGLGLGGYLQQSTAYVVSLLAEQAAPSLEAIWRGQTVPADLLGLAVALADPVRHVLTNAPGSANVTEWCKKDACWEAVRVIRV